MSALDQVLKWAGTLPLERLAQYLLANFAEFVRRRDDGISKGRPLCLHTYATPTARPREGTSLASASGCGGITCYTAAGLKLTCGGTSPPTHHPV